MLTRIDEFRKRLVELGRDELLDLLEAQDPELRSHVRRIEWVFSNKLTHLTWTNGQPVVERPVTAEELALLIDPPFEVDPELTRLGLNADAQRQAFIASDPVLWARHFLDAKPRAYQILMLRDPNKRKVLRAGRRLGKSWTLAVLMLHWAYTHNHARILVLTPMKSQAEVIFKELQRLAAVSETVQNSIVRAVTSPHPVFEFVNGSIIRFFSTGLKSGGKSDVARGQEAHVVVLDELDFMGPDDLDAILAMLQKTDDTQEEKVLVGASTPSGAQSRFFQWCQNPRFREFWFPSYVNPYFTREIEEEFREQYSDMVYRHEIEADWGEDTEGVYPRRWVEVACRTHDWQYHPELTSARSFFTIGVDWDKFGAGTNIVVLEVCQEDYEDTRFAGRMRVAWREEIPKDQFTLTKAVQRIIELNASFNPRHIYVDRGYGECVAPNTHITTLDGGKAIRAIEIGDLVLAQDGLFHEVTGKVVRPDAKPTYRVRVKKQLPVEVSDTHPFLVLDADEQSTWRSVLELQPGDLVATTALCEPAGERSHLIDLLNLVDGADAGDEQHVWPLNHAGLNGSVVPGKPISRYYDLLSADFLRFAGWFLSEGSESTNHVIEISQKTTEPAVVDEIVDCMERVFGRRPSVYVRHDRRKASYLPTARICLASKPAAAFVRQLFGHGQWERRIPEPLLANYDQLGPLLETLFRGDGHRTTAASSIELTLTSRTLIDQVRLILTTMGVTPSVYHLPAKRESRRDRWKLLVGGQPKIIDRFNAYTGLDLANPERIARNSSGEVRVGNHVFLPIISIEELGPRQGLVDIEVEGGKSFVGNGLLLHNTQVELLVKYGMDHPPSGLAKKVQGVSFSELITVFDPATRAEVKKEVKPYMVENLRLMLEREQLSMPSSDELIFRQLIGYVVARTSVAGRPVFQEGEAGDHAHDALLLACLAVTQNYGELTRLRLARRSRAVSGEAFLPTFVLSENGDVRERQEDLLEKSYGSVTSAPIQLRRAMTGARKANINRPIHRRKF